MPAQSLAELPDFPFPTFAALQDAHRHGRALIWVKFDFGAAWALDPSGRFGNALLCGAGIWGALIFVAFAWHGHDPRLLWGVGSCLVGMWGGSPRPGCVSGGGCAASLLLAGGALAALRTHTPVLLAVGFNGCLCWALTSLGYIVTDGLLRERMLRSEETFLWLLARGAIARVEEGPPPLPPDDDPPPDDSIWPPPPRPQNGETTR